MKINDFTEKLTKENLLFFATVPCTITAGLHTFLERQDKIKLFTTYHEHSLPGIAIGHYLATGRPAVIHMQNSGLPNAYDGLVTAIKLFQIPVLILVTWRGDSAKDTSEPHQLSGAFTENMTSSFGFPVFGGSDGMHFEEEMEKAITSVQNGKATILRIASNVFEKENIETQIPKESIADKRESLETTSLQSRGEALLEIRKKFDQHNTVFIYANGYTAREAYAISPSENNFYNIGYMGGSLAIGYALALEKTSLNVVVVDGDQNAQMSCMKDHLFAKYPENLHYFIIDNKIGASVGNAVSIPLADYYKQIAQIIEIPAETTEFTYERVEPKAGLRSLLDSLTSFISNLK